MNIMIYRKLLTGYMQKVDTKGINLYNLIQSKKNILLAYRNIRYNTESSTAGTDRITIDKYKLENKEIILEDIRELLKDYRPQSVRCIEISKPNGKKPPLGIPTLLDRLIQ